jgi:hypothetical protein
MVAGVNVVIRINRLWSRHVISALFPVLATTWLVSLPAGPRKRACPPSWAIAPGCMVPDSGLSQQKRTALCAELSP